MTNQPMFGHDDDWMSTSLARSALPSAIGSIVDPDDGTITTNDTSWAHLIIDMSGSMTLVKDAVVAGIARILKVCGKLAVMHLAILFFNSAVKQRHAYKPIGQVDPLQPGEYSPSGATAIGKAFLWAMSEAKLMGQTIAKTPHIPKLDNYLFVLASDGFSNSDAPQDAQTIRSKMRTKFFRERVKALAFFITDKSEVTAFHQGLSQFTYQDQGTFYNWSGTADDALVVLANTMFAGWGSFVDDEHIDYEFGDADVIEAQITQLIENIGDNETRRMAKIYREGENIIRRYIDGSYTTVGGFGLDPSYVFPVIKPQDEKAAAQQMADILGVKVSSSLQRHSQKLNPTPAQIPASTGGSPDDSII